MSISRKVGLHHTMALTVPLGKPAIFKWMDPSPADLRHAREQTGPDCLFVVRFFQEDEPVAPNPEALAEQWIQRYQYRMLDLQAAAGGNVIFEGYNEPGDREDEMENHCRFEVRRVTRMHQLGLRSGVGEFAMGRPPVEGWPYYDDLFDILLPTDALCLHEYWRDREDMDNWWHVARFTMPEIAKYIPSWLPICITEAGRDLTPDLSPMGYAGWRADPNCTEDDYVDELRYAGEIYDGIPQVVGMAVFQNGNDEGWPNYAVASFWSRISGDYNTGGIPSVPVPTPTPEPSVPLRLVPPIDKANIVAVTQTFTPPTHYGVDYSCVEGTPIYAAADGVARCLTDTHPNGGFGKYVRLETGRYKVYTAHLAEWVAYDGQRVQAGERVGLSGSTGNSTGPHVHFEVRDVNGSPYYQGAIDPEPLIDWPMPAVEVLQPAIIPYNPDAALYREALAVNAGAVAVSPEMDLEGRRYQAFRFPNDHDWQHWFSCVIGDWGNVRYERRHE